MLDKCLNDKNERELRSRIREIAEIHITGMTSVKIFVEQIREAITDWVIHMLPKQNVLEALKVVRYMQNKIIRGYVFIPVYDIITKEPVDAKDKFYKHFAISFNVSYEKLAFEIYKYYILQGYNNGNR